MGRYEWRLNFVLAGLLFFALALLSKLFFIQIVNHSFYRALAEGQQKWFVEQEGERGEIFAQDRKGSRYLLATDKMRRTLLIKPDALEDRERTFEQLGEILALEPASIVEVIGQTEEGEWRLVKDDLTQEEVEQLEAEGLAGVYLIQQKTRFYPQANLAAQTVGFLGGEGRGQYGVEGFYEDVLQGERGWLSGERNPWGFSLGKTRDEARGGADLVLTLDYYIQQKSEELLKEAEQELAIEEGQILVLEPASGRILALANFPSFDLNNYGEIKDQAIFQNSVLQKIFEPGSVFKPIVMAAALEEEKITPETSYEDTGFVKIGGYTIYNYDERVWGRQTMKQVLEKSINTGAVFVERQVGHDKFYEYISRFGFLAPTEVDLQGEIYSENRNLRTGREINFATAAFGQGVEVTPLQLARAFAAIANGGRLMRPYLVEKIIRPNGEQVLVEPVVQQEGVISQETASELTGMLVSVVEEGFAKRAKVPGYYTAGKTGTAQVALSVLGIEEPGYSEKTIQSFVGFFPAFEPQFLILVKLDNPQTRTAEYSAVPIFRELEKYIIDYWQLPPDYFEE